MPQGNDERVENQDKTTQEKKTSVIPSILADALGVTDANPLDFVKRLERTDQCAMFLLRSMTASIELCGGEPPTTAIWFQILYSYMSLPPEQRTQALRKIERAALVEILKRCSTGPNAN